MIKSIFNYLKDLDLFAACVGVMRSLFEYLTGLAFFVAWVGMIGGAIASATMLPWILPTLDKTWPIGVAIVAGPLLQLAIILKLRSRGRNLLMPTLIVIIFACEAAFLFLFKQLAL